ncbi:kinase-like domain-containing protein [Parasitella parasitica]|nr:kinase-like domain-containing protein [Parasitella parasitica]
MERIDSTHSDKEITRPILIAPPSTSPPSSHHHAKRSISGIEFLSGLKIMTSSTPNSDSLIPPSPVSSQLLSEHHFSQIDDFEIKEAIGYGSSAIVYKAIYKPLNRRMALKMIDLDKFERNQIDELRRETALMALSKHPNVLRVYGSFVHGSKLYIVTPYLAGGSCLDIMKTRFPEGLDETSIATILKQTLEALIYLHKNGHIHRDVKAGNLLMDEDGTVLLADFGVSSSLMETGERGMRKTFVGTPCWMAPEVMEQAEYDYKADIWSFGITAIELATGHAPFAKFPPLKVLMMTLSNEPPTLDRDSTIHKYSKSFKEMIDICLSKDPLKRPNAEKLLLHPFFKLSKRKDYLIKTILYELPPLEQRPRKKIPLKQVAIAKTDEWDFDDGNSNDVDTEVEELLLSDHNGPAAEQLVLNQQPQENTKPKPSARHISFGDVVVRNNSMSVHPADHAPALTSTSPPLSMTPPKKSRFVIEESSQDTSSSVRSSSPTHDEDCEVMKGRFYVKEDQPQAQQQQLHKMPSQDFLSANDRKSRFEVSSNTSSPMLYQPVPLSRDGSSYSSSSANSKPNVTAVTEKRYPPQELLTTENIALLTESSRKIGRFELTGGSNSSSVDITPRGSISSSHLDTHHHHQQHTPAPAIINPQYQIEELLRSNESQRILLHELRLNLKKTAAHSVANESENEASPQQQNNVDLVATVEHLDKSIQQTLKENARLQKENESLRRELKELKLN